MPFLLLVLYNDVVCTYLDSVPFMMCLSVHALAADPGATLNNPPLFSQDVYIDMLDNDPASSGAFLTTLYCTDEDDPSGALLTVSVQPSSLPFAVRVVRSTFEANGYDIVTSEMVDFGLYAESGLNFTASCSDGNKSDFAFVVLDVAPESFVAPIIISIPTIYLLETTATNTDIGTFSTQVRSVSVWFHLIACSAH